MEIERISLETGLQRLGALSGSQTVVSFYSSVLGGITTEKALFTLPIDDHMAHRGHAVFDTCTVHNGKAYGLTMHLDRFLKSARDCRITPPYAEREELREIILQTIAQSNMRNGIYVRFWMSAGRGDFNVYPSLVQPRTEFYCAVHTSNRAVSNSLGISEVSVSVPVKCERLATAKTNNYLVNALAAMEALERGGTLGLQCDSNGNVAECSIGSIAFVIDGKMHTPKLDKILRSTTLLRADTLWQRAGHSGFVFRDIPLSEAMQRASEVIGFGGSHLTCITKLDGKQIGTGEPGPLFQQLFAMVEGDIAGNGGSEVLDDIPYQ